MKDASPIEAKELNGQLIKLFQPLSLRSSCVPKYITLDTATFIRFFAEKGTKRNLLKKFIKVHNQVHEKPYDLNLYDWLCAEYNINCPFPEQDRFKHTNTFWCSALATYVLCEVGVVQNRVNWSLIAPRDFSSNEGKHLIFLCDLSNEILIY